MSFHLRFDVCILLMILFVLTPPLVADDVNTPQQLFAVLPHWKKGEKVSYEKTKIRNVRRNGPTSSVKSVGTYDIKVLDANENGFSLLYTNFESKQIEMPPDANANNAIKRIQQKVAATITDSNIVFLLDSEASIKDIKNWKELQKVGRTAIEVMCGEIKSAGFDEKMIQQIREQSSKMFATKEQIIAMSTREEAVFYAALALVFDDSKKIEYEGTVPNPFGGEPFPAQGFYRLKKVDHKKRLATITWEQVWDPNRAGCIMDETFDKICDKSEPNKTTGYLDEMAEKLQKRVQKPAQSNNQLLNLRVADTAEYEINIDTGWIEHFYWKHVSSAGDSGMEDILEIKRVNDNIAKQCNVK
jgi:hypothetical protein